jgi:hypothetical protein
MSLRLNSSGGGSVTLQEPTTASALTLDLPAVNGTVITTGDTGTITSAMIANGTVTPTDLAQPLTLATAQNTTSGTTVDFTGIPSWVRRVTVALNQVSLSGAAHILIQIGSGSVQTTGYTASGAYAQAVNISNSTTATNGVPIFSGSGANVISAVITFCLVGSNVYVAGYSGHINGGGGVFGGGSVTLSGAIDRVRITSANGTDTLDAGSVNILYEG